jgi:hypothetical protein
MNKNEQPGIHLSNVNPAHIVTVDNFSPELLRNLIAHLEASTDFEHLVYREAELDAVWSLTGFCLLNETDLTKRAAVERLHIMAQRAHELVADRRPEVAADVLRNCL